MTITRNELKQILAERNSPICDTLGKHIDIFNDTELQQIYLILHQSDTEKLKELYLYQNSQAKSMLDRIISLARELSTVETQVEMIMKETKETHLEEIIEQSIDLHYSIS